MDTAVGCEVVELDQDKRNHTLTKQELGLQIQQGHTLDDLLAFGPGQDCEIFKAGKFYPGDVVSYVPDVYIDFLKSLRCNGFTGYHHAFQGV